MCVCGPKKRGGDGQGKSSGVIEWSWIGEGGGERQTGRIGGGGGGMVEVRWKVLEDGQGEWFKKREE